MKRISKIGSNYEPDLSALDRFIGMSCAELNSELGLGVSLIGKSYVRTVMDGMLK